MRISHFKEAKMSSDDQKIKEFIENLFLEDGVFSKEES